MKSQIETTGIKKGGTLIEGGASDVRTFNPILVGDTTSGLITNLVYDSLLDVDPDTLEPIPNLATKWDVSPDGKTMYLPFRDESSWWVINAADGSIKSTIPITTASHVCASNPSELMLAAAADSSRVYVGNCDAGNVAIIQTLNDTLLLQMPAPFSASFGANGNPLPQNPVFVLAGP